MFSVAIEGKPARSLPDEHLTEFCLNVCGGGWTEQQTVRAMLLRDKLEREGQAQVKLPNGKKVLIKIE